MTLSSPWHLLSRHLCYYPPLVPPTSYKLPPASRFLREVIGPQHPISSEVCEPRSHGAASFRNGDRASVHTDHIRTARKLAKKKIGPYPLISQPSPMSFTLRLPSIIRIHSVFHVSPRPPPLIVDGKPEYLIERIIGSKYKRVRHKCQLLYHVKWTGYPITNNSNDWTLADAFDDKPGKLLTDALHSQHPPKPDPEHLAKDWKNRDS